MIKTLANSLSTRKPQKVHIALELLFRVQIVGSSVLPLLSLFLPLSLSLSLCLSLRARRDDLFCRYTAETHPERGRDCKFQTDFCWYFRVTRYQ